MSSEQLPLNERQVEMDEEMTREEMQRYLNQRAAEGLTRHEAQDKLMEVLGLYYPEDEKKKDSKSAHND